MFPSVHAEYSIAMDKKVVAANFADGVVAVPPLSGGAGVVVGVGTNGTIM